MFAERGYTSQEQAIPRCADNQRSECGFLPSRSDGGASFNCTFPGNQHSSMSVSTRSILARQLVLASSCERVINGILFNQRHSDEILKITEQVSAPPGSAPAIYSNQGCSAGVAANRGRRPDQEETHTPGEEENQKSLSAGNEQQIIKDGIMAGSSRANLLRRRNQK